jgi:PKD repeat protein
VSVAQGDGPTAEFVTSPDVPQVLQNVNFNGSASKAAAGRTIRSYAWDFGDGEQKTTTGPTTTHDYVRTGTFTVTLVVTDDAGRTGSQVHTVTVVSDSPVADFTVSPSSPRSGQVVAFNAAATPSAGRTIVSYSWDFGGPSASPATSGPNSSPTAQTTYGATGSYSVTLTVVDSAGKTGRVTKTVTVQ